MHSDTPKAINLALIVMAILLVVAGIAIGKYLL